MTVCLKGYIIGSGGVGVKGVGIAVSFVPIGNGARMTAVLLSRREVMWMPISGDEARELLRKLGLTPSGKPKRAKYGNEKVKMDGRTFDSIREAQRYRDLKFMLRAGLIAELELQKVFVLVPAVKGADGKVIERAVTYKADFYYLDKKTGKYVCEDTKGVRTKEYIIKRKLMLERFGIRIVEL